MKRDSSPPEAIRPSGPGRRAGVGRDLEAHAVGAVLRPVGFRQRHRARCGRRALSSFSGGSSAATALSSRAAALARASARPARGGRHRRCARVGLGLGRARRSPRAAVVERGELRGELVAQRRQARRRRSVLARERRAARTGAPRSGRARSGRARARSPALFERVTASAASSAARSSAASAGSKLPLRLVAMRSRCRCAAREAGRRRRLALGQRRHRALSSASTSSPAFISSGAARRAPVPRPAWARAPRARPRRGAGIPRRRALRAAPAAVGARLGRRAPGAIGRVRSRRRSARRPPKASSASRWSRRPAGPCVAALALDLDQRIAELAQQRDADRLVVDEGAARPSAPSVRRRISGSPSRATRARARRSSASAGMVARQLERRGDARRAARRRAAPAPRRRARRARGRAHRAGSICRRRSRRSARAGPGRNARSRRSIRTKSRMASDAEHLVRPSGKMTRLIVCPRGLDRRRCEGDGHHRRASTTHRGPRRRPAGRSSKANGVVAAAAMDRASRRDRSAVVAWKTVMRRHFPGKVGASAAQNSQLKVRADDAGPVCSASRARHAGGERVAVRVPLAAGVVVAQHRAALRASSVRPSAV